MGPLIETLLANPDIDTMVAVDEDYIIEVLSEVSDVHIGGYDTGLQLVEKLEQDPEELGSYLFFSEGLAWLLFSGKKRIMLVSRNFREMRSLITATHIPDELKDLMVDLLDKMIHHHDQQLNN